MKLTLGMKYVPKQPREMKNKHLQEFTEAWEKASPKKLETTWNHTIYCIEYYWKDNYS